MHRVEAQAIDMILFDPVERIVDEEIAYRPHAAVEIDRRTPGCAVPIGEELRRVEMQIVAVRPEVIVDHVEKHHQAASVGGVDQSP